MLTACPECGTQVVAGDDCPLCGTPTPAPSDSSPAASPAGPETPREPSPEAAQPVPGAAPPPEVGHSPPMDTGARYANQWEVIYEKLRKAVAPKYGVTGILGWGGMAGVYLADEAKLGRKVAIKVMSPGLMVDPQLVERFSQEARTIAQFNHPNIVTIYEVDERDGLHYFTMTYVPGRTLGQVMAGTEGALPIAVVRAWIYQIGDALSYAHHHGVIHRDVKPGNVLLDQRGNALVTDFGIAKVTDEPGLTRTGMLVGTPAYMSPEQCSSGKVEGASDQYSLGAVAYQMLTGQPPFSGPTLSVLQAHVGQEPRPIRELRPDCPDDLVAAVQRMLEKKPEDRWPTMSAAVAAAGASAPGFDGAVREQIEMLAAQAATIRVEPWFDVVREGLSEQLRATVLDRRGRTLEGRRVEWRSGDDLIASVLNGRIRAVSTGSTTIDAVCGGATTRLNLTVESDPVPSVEVEPALATVAAGARIPLDAIVTDWDGDRLDDRAVLWSSSDSSVARVNVEGVVEGVRPGEAVISASTGGKSAVATVTVTAAMATSAARGEPAPAATLRPEGKARPREETPVPTPATPASETVAAGTPLPSVVRHAQKPDGRPSPLMIGALSIVAVIAIGSAILLSLGGGDDPATQIELGQGEPPPVAGPPVAQPATGTLARGTDLPADASVNVLLPDGSSLELTDALQLEPGEYTVSVAASGFESYSGSVTVSADQTTTFQPTLERAAPPPPTSGTLRIAGNLPAGARLQLRREGGQFRVVSPGQITLDPGRYTLQFSADGYETDTQNVTIVAGESRTLTPNARATQPEQPPAPTTGTLRIDRTGLPAGSTITLRPPTGAARQITGSTVELAPGTYTIEFVAGGYRPFSAVVRIAAGQPTDWAPTLTQVTTEPPPDTPPARDPAADRAAVESSVRDFVAAFHRRDANTVVPLLPEAQRDAWRALLTNTSAVTGFSASLASIQPASLDGDAATVNFQVRVSYESGNAGQNANLRYVGTARRQGDSWRLVSLQPG